MAIDIKHIDYPARVQSGNINATAVAKATELAGFRQVNKLTDLYTISDFVLSDSGDNTNNDALMQQWWVQEEGKLYQLINWDNRKQASGWRARPDTTDLENNKQENILDTDDIRVHNDHENHQSWLYQNDRKVANFITNGYKILRPDNGNTLTQNNFPDTNTTYIIRYSFDLNNAEITIPDNCILKFEGGSLNNGTLIGTNTSIDADLYTIFSNITFKGYYVVDKVFAEWFGAKSLFSRDLSDNDSVTPAVLAPPKSVDDLQDSSAAINTAITFSTLSSGDLYLLGRAYKITNTINIPVRCTVHTTTSTMIFAYMHGDGKIIVTEELAKTSTKYTEETKEEPVTALLKNQYFKTETMKKAISINSAESSLVGGGFLSLVNSTYTIGIYVEGNGFRRMDVGYLTPEIDIQIAGGKPDETIINADATITINDDNYKAADISTLPQLGGMIWDKTDNKWWVVNKNNNPVAYYEKNTKIGGQFNTSMRLEAINGWNSSRIFNQRITIRDSWGFRGIEIIVKSPGWSNTAYWKGGIAYKQSHYIAIYNQNSVASQDFSHVLCQTIDAIMSLDGRYFYAHRCASVHIPYVYDVQYINDLRNSKAWYLGWETSSCRLDIDFFSRVEDYGSHNIVSQNNPEIIDVKDANNFNYRDILKYWGLGVSGQTNQILFTKLTEPIDLTEQTNLNTYISNNKANSESFEEARKELRNCFDDDYATQYTAIDTDNGKFGFIATLLGKSNRVWDTVLKGGITHTYLEIDYDINFDNPDQTNLPKIDICHTENGFYVTHMHRYEMRIEYTQNTPNTAKKVSKIIVPLYNQFQYEDMPLIAIYLTKSYPGLKLFIHAIRLYVNSLPTTTTDGKTPIYTPPRSYKYGTTANRPYSVQPGHKYFDTDLNRLIIWDGTKWVEPAMQTDTDDLRKVVYANHIYTNVSVSPNIGYKGENTEVTLTYNSGITQAQGLTPTYVVKKNGTEVTLASGAKETLTDTTTYAVTGSMGGVSKDGQATFNAYYPIYTFSSNNASVTALPDNATKQPVRSTPVGATYSITATNGDYLYLICPNTMSISGATIGGFDAAFIANGTIEVADKGTYNMYRTDKTQTAGTYNLLFK